MIHIQLLGTFQVITAGQVLLKGWSRKACALLGYLAAENRPIAREHLTALLWPQQQARSGGLRRELHTLRQCLPDCLYTDWHIVWFQPKPGCSLDIATFATLIRQGTAVSTLAAIELVRGPFLEGLDLPDCELFEEWLRQKRAEWEQHLSQAWHTLVTHYLLTGQYGLAHRALQRQLAQEPWREELHQQTMHVLALCGQRGAALKQYELCRRHLAEQFGVAPSAETVALYEKIRQGEIAVKPQGRFWADLPHPIHLLGASSFASFPIAPLS